ncbi:MAG TPA: NAD(P)-dependent oxidoreductase [Acidobacteriaceae bacterium]|jgi:3-hydroxyisobutyrate dehydrogenase|nr:NAD(P)-dependent oxidoreductase [Acidobacteriaceae bacterium]
MEETNIALLGLGLMGSGMAGRLLDAGYPLRIWNRTPGKTQPLVDRGAKLAKSPRDAAAGAAVVISMLADVPVCRDVWLGRGEALVDIAPGTILVESSTVTVEWIEELNRAANEHGCELVDAPVTGSKPQAAAGQLLFLAGGSDSAVDKITPILKAMGRDVVHVGPVGSGARLKLINNFLSGSQVAALAEALSLIERSGLDREKALGVLTEGAPGSPLVKLLSGRMTNRQYEPNFLLRLMTKDLRYAVTEAENHALDLDMGRAALRVFEHAVAAGQGEEDMSAVVEQFRVQAQTAK